MSGDTNGADIGGVYKAIGTFLGVCGMGLVAWRIGHPGNCGSPDRMEVGTLALPFVAMVILLRPALVDTTVKTVADKLPFVRYTKPGGNGS